MRVLGVLVLLAVLLGVTALVVGSPPALVACIVVGGALLGVMNTVLTESVMEATDLPRTVASSAYSGVRFIGGAAAPPLAAALAAWAGDWLPYTVAAVSVMIAATVVFVSREVLARVDHVHEDALEEAQAITAGEVV
jgi:MFS family permease